MIAVEEVLFPRLKENEQEDSSGNEALGLPARYRESKEQSRDLQRKPGRERT
jgi:hypothetical protein